MCFVLHPTPPNRWPTSKLKPSMNKWSPNFTYSSVSFSSSMCVGFSSLAVPVEKNEWALVEGSGRSARFPLWVSVNKIAMKRSCINNVQVPYSSQLLNAFVISLECFMVATTIKFLISGCFEFCESSEIFATLWFTFRIAKVKGISVRDSKS